MPHERLRNTILEEAILIFQKRGISTISEGDLLAALNISRSTMQDIAKDKEDLFFQAFKRNLETERAVHERIISQAPTAVEALVGLLIHGINNSKDTGPTYVSDLVRIPGILPLVADEINNYSTPLYKNLLNRGIQEKVFRHDINIEIVTKVIMENANLLLNDAIFPGSKYPLGEVARSIYMYYFRGLCTIEHISRVDEYFSTLR
jgi:AcrR family transcriptional regulator